MSEKLVTKSDISKLIKIYKKYTFEQLTEYVKGNNIINSFGIFLHLNTIHNYNFITIHTVHL